MLRIREIVISLRDFGAPPSINNTKELELLTLQKEILGIFKKANKEFFGLRKILYTTQRFSNFRNKLESHQKNNNSHSHYSCYVYLLEKIVWLFDDYFIKVNKDHVKIRTKLIRVNMCKALLVKNVLKAEENRLLRRNKHLRNNETEFRLQTKVLPMDSRSMVYPFGIKKDAGDEIKAPSLLKSFLSDKNRSAFAECLAILSFELEKAFCPETTLVRYVEKTQAGPDKTSNLRLVIIFELQELYPQITTFLDQLYISLNRVQKKHSEMLIQLLNELSIETCQEHKEEILEFFEDFLLEHMLPFFETYVLQQDLHFLTQDSHIKEPLNFLETALCDYLLMEDFELKFFEKIEERKNVSMHVERSSLESSGELADDKHVNSSLEQVLLPDPVQLAPRASSQAEDELDENNSLPTHEKEKTRAHLIQTKKALFVKKKATDQASLSPSSTPLPLPSAADEQVRQHVLSPFLIRRGEKLRKIIKKLKEMGLECTRQKGSHARFKNNAGEAVTLPIHSGPLTATVRRGMRKQLNEEK